MMLIDLLSCYTGSVGSFITAGPGVQNIV